METHPDCSSLLHQCIQLIRPENDVCGTTRGAGTGAQQDGESVICDPPYVCYMFCANNAWQQACSQREPGRSKQHGISLYTAIAEYIVTNFNVRQYRLITAVVRK